MIDKSTTIFKKLFASLINVVVVFIIALPFLFWMGWGWPWRLLIIGLFFSYNLGALIFNNNRCLGMVIAKTKWAKEYSKSQHLLWIVLYTLSFATLFIWIRWPFDLFLINMLILQLPSVLITGTTLHGLLSGKMETVKQM